MLRAYKAYYDEHAEPPTVRWLAEHLGKSVTRIQVMLATCKSRGDIQHVTIIRPIPGKAPGKKPKRRTG